MALKTQLETLSNSFLENVAASGKLIFISVYTPSKSINFSTPSAFIPTITDANGKNECISATDIYIPDRVDKSAYTVIYKIDVKK